MGDTCEYFQTLENLKICSNWLANRWYNIFIKIVSTVDKNANNSIEVTLWIWYDETTSLAMKLPYTSINSGMSVSTSEFHDDANTPESMLDN